MQATKIYTAEQFHFAREVAGNFFEQNEGYIVWRQTGQAVEEEILEAIFNNKEVNIAYMTTKEHADIILNLNDNLSSIDKKQFCVYIQDPCICIMIDGMRLRARIPDVTVTPRQRLRNDFGEVLNPLVIFEVISPTSVKTDYVEKLTEYKYLESLQDYIVVEQKEVKVTHHQRLTANEWIAKTYTNRNDVMSIATVQATLHLAAIYENVL